VPFRFDVAAIGAARRSALGGLEVPATLTRAGVFTYRDTAGNTIRELRPIEEVLAPESLATLRGVPVTDLHPPELVTPENFRTHARGHVLGDAVPEGGTMVGAVLAVQDAELIGKVERGDAREVSLGYEMEIDPTPGVWNGEAYDQIQRRIRYNHAALGPVGWGRAGRDVALRLDAGAAIMDTGLARPPRKDRPPMFPKITFDARARILRIDGEAYPLATSEGRTRAAGVLAQAQIRVGAKAARLDGDAAEMVAAALGQIEALQASLMELGAALGEAAPAEPAADAGTEEKPAGGEAADSAATPAADASTEAKAAEALDAAVAERIATRERAAKVAPSVVLDAKASTREIMAAVVAAVAPEVRIDSDTPIEFVRGVFAALPEARSNLGDVLPRPGARNDAGEHTDPRARLNAHLAGAWRRPEAGKA
jgi:hypothetical protein